jgi:hypothetical protein
MTISATVTTGPYTGNGLTTVFPFDFTVSAGSEVTVQVNGTLIAPSLYTVAVNDSGTGSVTFYVAPPIGAVVLIVSAPDFQQESPFPNQAAYNLSTINAINRRQTVRSNWLRKAYDRAFKLPLDPLSVAGRYPVVGPAGEILFSSGTGSDPALRSDLATAASGTTLIAHRRGGTLQTALDRVALTPERFGADGLATTDQTTAMADMMTAARAVGKATIQLTDGNTYTTTNPFIWGGLSELTIIGGKIMNGRSGAFGGGTGAAPWVANWQSFRSPIPSLPNGTDTYDPILPAQGYPTPYYGDGCTVATCAANSTSLTSLVGTAVVGEAFLYGWDRIGEDGFPPVGSYQEKINITAVVGTAITLQRGTKHAYDQRAPAKANRAGPAQVFMLNRAGSATVRPHTHMKKLHIVDTEFVINPAQSGLPLGNNGIPGFGGADEILLEGVKAPGAFVTVCGTARLVRCQIDAALEIDKMIETVIIDGGAYGGVVAGIGCERIIIRGGARIAYLNVAPTIELVIEPGCFINGVPTAGNTAMISLYAYGTQKVTLYAPTFSADISTHDRLFDAGKFDLVPATINRAGYTTTRAAFDASGHLKQMRVGSTVYSGRVAVGVVTAMPTCPTPNDLFTGDVFVAIKWFGPVPAPGATLSLFWLENVRVVGKPVFEGVYARQVQSTLGNDQSGFRPANVRDWQLSDNWVEFGQEVMEYNSTNAASFHFGRGFKITEVLIDVISPAVVGGAIGMFVGGDLADGTNIGVVASIDLKTAGLRRLDRTGFVGGVTGADVLTYAWPTLPLVNFNVTDNSRNLDRPVSISIAAPGVVTLTSHNLAVNSTFVFQTTGALPTGLTAGTTYYVRNPTTNTFEVSLTSGGASIATSGTQSGVHTVGSGARWRILARGYFA